ncbi:MAG: DUF4416 family protein [Candidatus Aminicenantes bacterium]|nr:MAG: DUF4416 family protein [Candidatus Aminicenantes bacterium]
MTEPKPFSPVKLICGIIASDEKFFKRAEERLVELYGSLDLASQLFAFNFTDYYEKQMGQNLKRKFVSFGKLISPEELSGIKIRTNALEEEIKEEFKAGKRIVNLDPGYMTASALIMATAKDFAHRIPLQHGIYAHLELLFGKNDVRTLSWTYPDFETESYRMFLLDARRIYLSQIQSQIKS